MSTPVVHECGSAEQAPGMVISGSSPMSAKRLVARARRLLWIAIAPLVLLVLLLAVLHLSREMERMLQLVAAEMRLQSYGFRLVAQEATVHVANLRLHTERGMSEGGSGRVDPGIRASFAPRVSPSGRIDGMSLDSLPAFMHPSMAQLCWPDTTPGGTQQDGLVRAQQLSPVMELAHARGGSLVWSYHFAWPDKHFIVYPWTTCRAMFEDQGAPNLPDGLAGFYEYELFTASMPDRNPSRGPIWTAPYIDAGGKGVMVSHVAPVWAKDEFRGIVGTDIALATLEAMLASLPAQPWRAWVLDDRGHVLADRQQPISVVPVTPVPTGTAGSAPPPVPKRTDRLPKDIDEALITEAALESPMPHERHGWQVTALNVRDAPWTVVLAAPTTELWTSLLPTSLPYVVITLSLVGFGVVAQILLARRLIMPLLHVLDYLEKLVADPDQRAPRVNPRWQPWIDVLSRTFESLRKSIKAQEKAEALKSALIDHAQAAVVVADQEERIVEFNPAAETMFACTRAQAIGRPLGWYLLTDLGTGDGSRPVSALASRFAANTSGNRRPGMGRRGDGTLFPIEMAMWMTSVQDERFISVSVLDITAALAAREEIESQREQLRQSEKLTTMGSLLAGVAHELNNPLAIVVGRSSLLEERLAGTPSSVEAQRVRFAAERCGRIVRTFLNLARCKPLTPGPVQVNDLARTTAEMVGYTMRSHDVELTLELGDDVPQVHADGDQLGQVILNLLVNAQHALLQKVGPRRITVRTRTERKADGTVVVQLVVSDNGPGVPAELRERIFEPFFTTKPLAAGTGLGLSVSRSIAREHQGDIIVDDLPSGGARFTLVLPTGAGLVSPGAGHEAAMSPSFVSHDQDSLRIPPT
jgi:PAS domain S-box-containing protein